MLSKQSIKVILFSVLSALAAFTMYSLLHGRHTGVYFPWQGGFVVLPLRHWVVFALALLLSAAMFYIPIFKTDTVMLYKKRFKEITASEVFPERAFMFALLSIIVFVFAYSFRNIAFTNDDVITGYNLHHTTTWSEWFDNWLNSLLGWRGSPRARFSLINWIQALPFGAFDRIVTLSNNTALYVLLLEQVIRLVNAAFFAYIVSKRISSNEKRLYFGVLIVALFYSFLSANHDRTVVVAYPLWVDLGILRFLISVELFLRFFEKPKKWHLPVSALLLVTAFFSYESFLMYTVLFPIYLLCIKPKDEMKRFSLANLLNILYTLRFHIIAGVYYLFSLWFQPAVFRMFHGGAFHYGGSTLYLSGSLSNAPTVIWRMATNLFPLGDFIRHGHYNHFDITEVSEARLIMAFCTTVLFCAVLVKKINITGKQVVAACLVSLTAAFIKPIPLALTPMWSELIMTQVVNGHIPSYHSYFWFILVIVVLLVYLYQLCGYKKLLLIVLAPVVFMTTVFVGFVNERNIETFEAITRRRVAFRDMVSSEYFANTEDGAHILLQGFSPPYGDMSRVSRLPIHLTGRTLHFVTGMPDMNYVDNLYLLRYDSANEVVIYGRIDSYFVGNEFFAIPTQPILRGGVVGLLSNYVTEVHVNGEMRGVYYGSFTIPLTGIGSEGIFVEADGIRIDQVSIIDSQVSSNRLLGNFVRSGDVASQANRFLDILVSGWSYIDEWGVWSIGNTAEIGFEVSGSDVFDGATEAELTLGVLPFQDPYLMVYVGDSYFGSFDISLNNEIVLNLPLELLGEHNWGYSVRVRFEVENPASPLELGMSHDDRILGVLLQWLSFNVR